MFTPEKIERILEFVHANKKRIKEAKDLFTINEGQLLPFVEEAMNEELSATAFKRARNRIAPINIYPKVINKLSTLYIEPPSRVAVDDPQDEIVTDTDTNQTILDYYSKEFSIDPNMINAQKQFNVNRYDALEPFLDLADPLNPRPKLRVLPAHQFLVWSDDPVDPTKVTVFIKILGHFKKMDSMLHEGQEIPMQKEVTVFMLYDNDQIIAIDSDGEPRPEFMPKDAEGNSIIENPFGTIPFTYISNSNFSLLPLPNTDDKPMTILAPIIATDLNYAHQYLSHSIIYSIDGEIENLSANPDSIWQIKSDPTADGADTKQATIGTIRPEVDIPNGLKLMKTEIMIWLDTKGIRATSVGELQIDNVASGISKMIDEGDTTIARREQETLFKMVERDFWKLVGIMHNTWLDSGVRLKETRKTSGDLLVNVVFPEQKPLVNEEELIRTEVMKLEAGLTSRSRAVAKANPDLDITEISKLIQEIDNDSNSINFVNRLADSMGDSPDDGNSDGSDDDTSMDNSSGS